MKSYNDLDVRMAELVSTFTDELNSGRALSFEAFLEPYPEMAEQLRPILRSLLEVRHRAESVHLSEADSDRMFARIIRRVEAGPQTASAILDRRPDFLILLLHFMKRVWNIDVWGNIKLVKLLFLLGKEGGCDKFVCDFYGHYAYSFGAFDENVPKDAEMLARKNVIEKYLPPSRASWSNADLGIPSEKQVDGIYRLTPKGKKIAEALVADALRRHPDLVRRVEEIVRRYGKKSTDELLDYTYNKYPETTANSKVKDQYLRKKPETDGGNHDA